MRRSLICLSTVLLAIAVLAFAVTPPVAGDEEAPTEERGKLVDNPLADAKPGEYLRYVVSSEGWSNWYVERVLAVRDGEVLFHLAQTDTEGKKITSSPYGPKWTKVPAFKPRPFQRILDDKMVELEVNGKLLWCRHIYMEELERYPLPEPKHRRDVWYSNDVGCTGRVQERLPGNKRTLLDWGMMPEDQLKKALEEYEKAEQRRKEMKERK